MDTTESNSQATGTNGQLKRRGMMAGVAALAGAGLAKLLGPGRAEAGHDGTNVFHLGVGNNLWGTAHLSVAAPNGTALQVTNSGGGSAAAILAEIPLGSGSVDGFSVAGYHFGGGTGVVGFGGFAGMHGSSSQWGVYGDNSSTNTTLPPAGVAGNSVLEIGVVGRSANNTGVYGIAVGTGPNLTVAGVTGTSTTKIGVLGTSTNESGLVGVSGGGGPGTVVAGAVGTSTTRIGVLGTSGSNTGVHGLSTSGHGVFGQTSATAGTVVNGMLAAGLAGRTGSTIALYGYADGPANPNYAPVGAVGQCESGFGLWGLSGAGPGATSRPGGGSPTAISGVLGTSASGVGMYAISSGSYALAADANGPSTVGALIRGNGGGRAAVFVGNVEINGHLSVTGGVNGPVSTAQVDGTSARSTILDNLESLAAVGEGQLAAGRADVRLDPAFAAALSDDRYHVFLTEYDDHHGLYVTGRTRQGFEVRAKDSPTASSLFSYRVVGRPRTVRTAIDPAPTPLHVPTLPVPQGVPTLPTGPADPQPATPPSSPAQGPRPR
jgi:hypothetical protein